MRHFAYSQCLWNCERIIVSIMIRRQRLRIRMSRVRLLIWRIWKIRRRSLSRRWTFYRRESSLVERIRSEMLISYWASSGICAVILRLANRPTVRKSIFSKIERPRTKIQTIPRLLRVSAPIRLYNENWETFRLLRHYSSSRVFKTRASG